MLDVFPALYLGVSEFPFEISSLLLKMFISSQSILYYCKILFESMFLSCG